MTSIEFNATPLETARESLKTIEAQGSSWRLETYYYELVNSVKSVIDIYSKM
jgi:hypothetical protein